jgi:hypothetical protein
LTGAVSVGGTVVDGALMGTSTRAWQAGHSVYCPASAAPMLDVALQRGQSSLTHTMTTTRYKLSPE